MTRPLVFEGDKAALRFKLLRMALLCAGDGKGERTREVIRKEARLLDALDEVSIPVANQDDERELKPEGGTITLKQEDFELLSRYVDTCSWVPRVSRPAVDLQDWLSATEKIEK